MASLYDEYGKVLPEGWRRRKQGDDGGTLYVNNNLQLVQSHSPVTFSPPSKLSPRRQGFWDAYQLEQQSEALWKQIVALPSTSRGQPASKAPARARQFQTAQPEDVNFSACRVAIPRSPDDEDADFADNPFDDTPLETPGPGTSAARDIEGMTEIERFLAGNEDLNQQENWPEEWREFCAGLPPKCDNATFISYLGRLMTESRHVGGYPNPADWVMVLVRQIKEEYDYMKRTNTIGFENSGVPWPHGLVLGFNLNREWFNFLATHSYYPFGVEDLQRVMAANAENEPPQSIFWSTSWNQDPEQEPPISVNVIPHVDLPPVKSTWELYATIPNKVADAAQGVPPADPPVYKASNQYKKPIHLRLYTINECSAWWGHFVDDGPRRAEEGIKTYRRRLMMARDNMRIEFRAPRRKATRADVERQILKHNDAMASKPAYRKTFIAEARRVHAENNKRRLAALEYRNRETRRAAESTWERGKNRQRRVQDVEFREPACNATDLFEVEFDDEGEPVGSEEAAKWVGYFPPPRKCEQCALLGTGMCDATKTAMYPCHRCRNMGQKIKWYNPARPFCYPGEIAGASDHHFGLEGERIYFTGPWLLTYWAKDLAVVPDQADTIRTRKDERKARAKNVLRPMRNPATRWKPRDNRGSERSRSASPVRNKSGKYRECREPLVRKGEKGNSKAKECERCDRLGRECDGKDPCNECIVDSQGYLCQFQTTDNTFSLADDGGTMYDFDTGVGLTPCGRCTNLGVAEECDGREPCNHCWAAERVCYPQGTEFGGVEAEFSSELNSFFGSFDNTQAPASPHVAWDAARATTAPPSAAQAVSTPAEEDIAMHDMDFDFGVSNVDTSNLGNFNWEEFSNAEPPEQTASQAIMNATFDIENQTANMFTGLDSYQTDAMIPTQKNTPGLMTDDGSDLDAMFNISTPSQEEPSWEIDGLREGYDTKDLWDGQNVCTEDLSYFDSAFLKSILFCQRPGARECDVVADLTNCSCRKCHDEQPELVKLEEDYVLGTTRIPFCLWCSTNLDQERRTNPTAARISKCRCFGKLQSTWICHPHRDSLRADILAEAMKRWERLAQNGKWNLCGNCGVTTSDLNSPAWKCILCKSVVILNP